MPYIELHCHSAYSFLDGASLPVELAAAASEQGHRALALTDHDGLHGAMEFAQAARPLGLRPITGAELTLDDGSHITLLCESRAGYTNLCRLITRAHEGTRERPSEPEPPSIPLEDVERHAEGLVCLTGCARNGALAARVERGEHAGAAAVGRRLLHAFGPERLRVELQRPFARHDRRRNRLLAELAERLGVPCVATGNVHVHARSRVPLQDALAAVRLGTTLDESEPGRRGNASHVLAPPSAMAARFPEHPEAVGESGRIAERLEFDIMRDLGSRRSCGSSARSGCPASSCSTATCSSWRVRWQWRCAARTPLGRSCRPGAGAARASPRSSATSRASRTSTRSRTGC